jgi:ABC-type lipoprotein export system ATPase subunit
LTRLNQQGITVVVVTHEHDVAAYANRTITFKDGRVLSDQKNVLRNLESTKSLDKPLQALQGDNSL